MRVNKLLFGVSILIAWVSAAAQSSKGTLFIIGGGGRPPSLMQTMLNSAGLQPEDYIAVLPMSSAEPDSSFLYFKADIEKVSSNPAVNFNFTNENPEKQSWLDSLQNAKLIFITGGDQQRFMNIVWQTPVYEAIHTAFKKGATIAGTSAGAAVMSKYMITGRALKDTDYHATLRRVEDSNLEIKEGLGLLETAIVDQHFIVRSRYNRLLSALARYPKLTCIGIDEATAIIVKGNSIKVTGESQVAVISNPESLRITKEGLIKFSDLRFSFYTDGDEFRITGSK
jgi:cyanophycinase